MQLHRGFKIRESIGFPVISQKKNRGEALEIDRVVIDCVLADNTGPLMATFWDDSAKQVEKMISEYGFGCTVSIQGF